MGISKLFFIIILSLPNIMIGQNLFQKHSTWYEKIPANPEIMENSDNYIKDIIINSPKLSINNGIWGTTIWYADENTPYQTIESSYTFPPAEWKKVPIPDDAQPPGGFDGHMVVISHDRKFEWDFYSPQKMSNGVWRATRFRRWDLTTDGINSPYDLLGSCQLAPVPLTHGIIFYEEIKQGKINHALAFAYNSQRLLSMGTNCIYPCEKINAGTNNRQWALWLGFRIQLNPDLDIESLNLPRSGKIIAKALQEYGMIFVMNDGVGSNSVIAESLTGKAYSWEGLLSPQDTHGLPLNQLRVIKPIYPKDFIQNDLNPPACPTNIKIRNE